MTTVAASEARGTRDNERLPSDEADPSVPISASFLRVRGGSEKRTDALSDVIERRHDPGERGRIVDISRDDAASQSIAVRQL